METLNYRASVKAHNHGIEKCINFLLDLNKKIEIEKQKIPQNVSTQFPLSMVIESNDQVIEVFKGMKITPQSLSN